jgi:hypothetical protein
MPDALESASESHSDRDQDAGSAMISLPPMPDGMDQMPTLPIPSANTQHELPDIDDGDLIGDDQGHVQDDGAAEHPINADDAGDQYYDGNEAPNSKDKHVKEPKHHKSMSNMCVCVFIHW